MAELHQRTVVKVHCFFNVYKKNGWETEFAKEYFLYNPTPEQVKNFLLELYRELQTYTLYTKRGERDRHVVCEAIYPIVHENSVMGYWGDKIAEANFSQSGGTEKDLLWYISM